MLSSGSGLQLNYQLEKWEAFQPDTLFSSVAQEHSLIKQDKVIHHACTPKYLHVPLGANTLGVVAATV